MRLLWSAARAGIDLDSFHNGPMCACDGISLPITVPPNEEPKKPQVPRLWGFFIGTPRPGRSHRW